MCCPSSRCITVFFSLLGLGLSFYALHVETQASKDPNYIAFCDIADLQMSCSKVFSSKYGRGFGLVADFLGKDHPLNQPNSIFGIIFYSLIILLSFINVGFLSKIQTFLCFLSVGGSIYLGYVLYFILQELCPVCISTYIINFILFISSYCKMKNLGGESRGSGRGGKYQTPGNYKKYI